MYPTESNARINGLLNLQVQLAPGRHHSAMHWRLLEAESRRAVPSSCARPI
jgi:hypothetical protein